MLVADAVAETLVGLGADTVFGLVGSGNFRVTNGLTARGARFVAARHEGGAASMADGWARLAGRPGLLSVHQGPGLTNAVTGITEAAKARTPLVVLAADVADAAVRSNFRIDVAALATAIGAVPERLHSAESAVADTARAYRTAAGQRRTVLLAMPLDVQAAQCDPPETSRDGAAGRGLSGNRLSGTGLPGTGPPGTGAFSPPAPAPDAAAELARALTSASRPVFIAGRGARVAGARRDLEDLADACGALLATSAAAKGLFRGSPWDLDVSGGFASPLAAQLIGDADLVVAWGCSLNMWTTRHGKLIGRGCQVAQVDDDTAAIGAHHPVHLGVFGDVAVTARAATAALGFQPNQALSHQAQSYQAQSSQAQSYQAQSSQAQSYQAQSSQAQSYQAQSSQALSYEAQSSQALSYEALSSQALGHGYRTGEIRQQIAETGRWRDVPYADESGEGRIDPRTLSIVLDDLLPAQRLVAVDSGNFMGYPSMFMSVPDEQGFCFTQAYQSVGLGLGSAIGSAIARPDRLTVAALGDGGALMGVSELETVVRLGLPMVIVVYNDEAYGAEVHHFHPHGPELDTVRFPPTDIAEIGRGFGFEGVTVREPDDLAQVSRWLDGPRERPLLIDAKVTARHGSWWLEEAFRGH